MRKIIRTTIAISILIGLVPLAAFSTERPSPKQEEKESQQEFEARMEWWREARFGMFIHWGPVSLLGTELSWSRAGERRGVNSTGYLSSKPGFIPVEVYDSLYQCFYPARFDAREWTDLAKDAGMKYIVFTTKHHDGFCLFDSKLTEHKITNSPFKRDVVKELADACHEAGIHLGFYYSQLDWFHPDFRKGARHKRYIEYLHGQVRELCTNYGKIDILFFDYGGTVEEWESHRMFKMVRELQPDIVINNRLALPGDYDTPEQEIGDFQNDRPWESNMTIGQQWAWKTNDDIKSLKECIQTLVRVNGGDGNFLFNVGPMPTGAIEPRQAERLKEMGLWLSKYGESIYSTRGGPFKPGLWGASTFKDDIIYLHILEWKEEMIKLPTLDKRIVSSELLTGGTVKIKQDDKGFSVTVPQPNRQEIDTIVKLKIGGR